ncbi:MAG: NFACT family protein [Allobaculum sp.]|nr:NFACT family protein [Allobaculum sp.]
MPFDGLLLHRTIELLKPWEGSKIGKIQSLSDDEVLFFLHKPGLGSARLAISVHSNTCRLYLCSKSKEPLPNPSSFVMLLRKRISQGIIVSIDQMDFDRLVRFRIIASDEFADRTEYDLYAEMMGKYANLILVDAKSQKIIDCLKRIPVFENSKRLLHPGADYTLPEKPKRYSPLSPGPLDVDKSLVSQIEGFSPSLSREVLYRLHQGANYADILDQIEKSTSLYRYSKDFHCLPLLHLESKEIPEVFPLMEGLETLFEQDEAKKRIALQCGDVFKAVDREIQKLSKKLPKLLQSLEESQEYDRYRQYGDVLFANLDVAKTPKVSLPSFEDDTMLEIPLDMRYSIKDNANLFYKKYHKMKRGIAMLQEQIETCENQLEYFQTLKEQLNYCSVEDVLEVRQELAQKHILRLPTSPMRGKKSQKKVPHVIRLRMGDATIYAGKNNLQNQYITWHLARRNDLWFHVKDYHGSHVLLQSENPTEAQIRFCAMLAAWFSKGRYSSSVPVDYTKVFNLKRIPKKGPGFVSMKTYQTIFIDPETKIIENALKSKIVEEDA